MPPAQSPTLCIATLLVVLTAPGAIAVYPKPIQFQKFDEALRRGMAQGQVTIIYFTADWCSWCRKMHATTFADPQVQQLADKFSWAKVDIDDSPELAAMFRVQGVPAVGLLNVKGEILRIRSGYVSPSAMTKLLDAHQDKAQAPGQVRKRQQKAKQLAHDLEAPETVKTTGDTMVETINVLARSQRRERIELTQRVIEAGSRAWPKLLAAMSDVRLAIRAAAYDLLRESTAANLAFDSFAEPAIRVDQLKAWQTWIQQNPPPRAGQGKGVAQQSDQHIETN